MRTLFLSLALGLAAAGPALAECRDDVVAAFDKQRKAGTFRMVANVVGARGPMTLTLDYVLPDKLHQTVKFAIQETPVEAILIGSKAWVNEGSGWNEANKDEKDELTRQLAQVSEETPESLGQFDCLGSSEVDGARLNAYLAIEGPRDKSKPQTAPVNKDNRAERIIYVDPTTGLPVQTIMALPGKYDRPIFKAVYSYPVDIKVEPPPGR